MIYALTLGHLFVYLFGRMVVWFFILFIWLFAKKIELYEASNPLWGPCWHRPGQGRIGLGLISAAVTKDTTSWKYIFFSFLFIQGNFYFVEMQISTNIEYQLSGTVCPERRRRQTGTSATPPGSPRWRRCPSWRRWRRSSSRPAAAHVREGGGRLVRLRFVKKTPKEHRGWLTGNRKVASSTPPSVCEYVHGNGWILGNIVKRFG